VFSEKYITAACNFQKGVCKILRWLSRQIQKILNLMAVLWRILRKLKKSSAPDVLSNQIVSSPIPIDSQTVDRQQLAIESRAILLEVLGTDARHRTEMRRLLREADAKLQLLGCKAHTSLIEKAMTQMKGTTIKQYARSILEASNL